jgi:hypothetical protein
MELRTENCELRDLVSFAIDFSAPDVFIPLSSNLSLFSLINTGLSGIKKLIKRNSAAGNVSAQNIQRQPHSIFHV